jgi:xylulose-5-phosphate/fructose-6-phosphate phosphoketolase
MRQAPLTSDEFNRIDAWWRAANYLSIGQVYLLGNPLLREPLETTHTKPRLLGHWGTVPGLNFLYAHLNRVIQARNLNVLFVTGPGHGAPGIIANSWLEGTYSELYPDVSQDELGMCRLFRQFSFPGGIPSHTAPETPGSLHEGGELGYCLAHSYGAVFDNPDLIAISVIGDGEAETGPLAGSWHGNKFINPIRDGAVLPVLHLNGYKIANPTILARLPHTELESLLRGLGHEPIFVEGDDPSIMHQKMAAAFDAAFDSIARIQNRARLEGNPSRPIWPMIVLRTPKGWTCPKTVDGVKTEGFWRAHQVPFELNKPGHLALLEQWMKSYRPEELFDENGGLRPDIKCLAPTGTKRMSANPHSNGGQLLRPLRLPDIRDHEVSVAQPGDGTTETTSILGKYLCDVMKGNTDRFRLFGPDETASNRLQAVFAATSRTWEEPVFDYDDHLAPDGRVMEILSEHNCQGWLEGYLLSGRHGLFSCYEAFIHIVDSMLNQHAKWLKSSREVPWRRPIASLNYLLTSHVWRQDHNGFSHQDPGFIDLVANKKADTVRIYFPPDANTLLYVADHCLRSWDRINVIVAGKQPEPQWLDMDEAIKHCEQGIGIWEWASHAKAPDVVMAAAGDVPTLETLAAIDLLRRHLPQLSIRMINVVDLMALQTRTVHPHGLEDSLFDVLFTKSKPVIFAYHGYPSLIHKLTYKRANHENFHVHGFEEEGTTTTPFDMVVRNRLDRFHLVLDVLDRVPGLGDCIHLRSMVRNWLVEHRLYITNHGEDMPVIRNWKWPAKSQLVQP